MILPEQTGFIQDFHLSLWGFFWTKIATIQVIETHLKEPPIFVPLRRSDNRTFIRTFNWLDLMICPGKGRKIKFEQQMNLKEAPELNETADLPTSLPAIFFRQVLLLFIFSEFFPKF